MTAATREAYGTVPVVHLRGEVGPEEIEVLEGAFAQAGTRQRVIVDLSDAPHIHYRVAGALVRLARARCGIGVAGASPYVRQILRLAGAFDGQPTEYRDLEEALEDATG